MKELTQNPLFGQLAKLELPTADFAVFGSGPMYAYALREQIHDLDLIARGSAWKKAAILQAPVKPASGDGNVIRLFDDAIEIFDSWAPGEWDVNEVIDTAEVLQEIKFVTLANVLKWKKLMGREKDLTDIQKIEEYLKHQNSY